MYREAIGILATIGLLAFGVMLTVGFGNRTGDAGVSAGGLAAIIAGAAAVVGVLTMLYRVSP